MLTGFVETGFGSADFRFISFGDDFVDLAVELSGSVLVLVAGGWGLVLVLVNGYSHWRAVLAENFLA